MKEKNINLVTALLLFADAFLAYADKWAPAIAEAFPKLSHSAPLILALILAAHSGVKAILGKMDKLHD